MRKLLPLIVGFAIGAGMAAAFGIQSPAEAAQTWMDMSAGALLFAFVMRKQLRGQL